MALGFREKKSQQKINTRIETFHPDFRKFEQCVLAICKLHSNNSKFGDLQATPKQFQFNRKDKKDE